jgi:thiamine biosynthesis lipoprotein
MTKLAIKAIHAANMALARFTSNRRRKALQFYATAGKRPKRFRGWNLLLLLLTGGASFGNMPHSFAHASEGKSTKYERTEVHMGSPFTIVFYSDDENVANRAMERSFARIAQLDKVLSDYDLESEASRLCASAPHAAPVSVSSDLYAILAVSAELHAKTSGAFDVTVGPVTKLWRRARRQQELPNQDQLAEALSAVGMETVKLDQAQQRVRITKAGVRLDFGGIGQGFAADEVVKILSELGIRQCLVNASGDVVALDPPPGKEGWKVALVGLQDKSESPREYVYLKNGCITTSGDAFQSVEIDGKRYSHIVDPATGLGGSRRISATVFAKSGAEADALATALCVIPVENALKILKREFSTTEALILELRDAKPVVTATKGFPPRKPIP